MPIREEMVALGTSDGFKLDAFVAHVEGASRGGLVILQEIFGLTDQLKSVARSYAIDGYDTIVPALFDRVSPQTVVPFDDPDGGRALMMQLNNDEVMLDIEAAINHVDQDRGISVLGFCWGGGMALKAACTLNLTSSISYYGTKLTTFLETPPKCSMLFHFGETDMMNTPPEVIKSVKDAIPDAETYVYAAGHAFANDARKTYVPDAAIKARERSLAFLNAQHG
jgi:carboxymethylenebutenolidase